MPTKTDRERYQEAGFEASNVEEAAEYLSKVIMEDPVIEVFCTAQANAYTGLTVGELNTIDEEADWRTTPATVQEALDRASYEKWWDVYAATQVRVVLAVVEKLLPVYIRIGE